MKELNETTKAHVLDTDSVLDDQQPRAMSGNETATGFETAEINRPVRPAKACQAPDSCNSKNQNPAFNERKTPGRTSNSAIVIRTEDSGDNDLDNSDDSNWETTYRGMPSWMSSLIIHLSIILVMALLTVNNGGKKIVGLMAATTETVELEPFTKFDVVLEPEQIETVANEIELPESSNSELVDLAPILDEALISTNLDHSNENLFEKISSNGIDSSDLRRNAGDVGARFFGVEGQGADFVFIVDCSGSMADYGRWPHAVKELKKSINELKPDQKFLILLYNDGFIAMHNKTKLVKSTERERNRAIRWLSNKRPNSWTFCAEALAKAIKLKPDAIFLLSDGEFNDRMDVFFVLDSLNNELKLKSSDQNQIPVHTIALGSHEGRYTMKRIADENSGLFRLIE